MTLLSKILNVLPAAQKFAVKALLERKKRLNEIRGARAELAEAERIYNDIRSKMGKQIFNPIFAKSDEKISSATHNKNMEQIFIDLNGLYDQIDQLAKSSQRQGVVLQSEYARSRAAILKLINDARVFSLRKQYPDFTEIKVVDFNSAQNKTTDIPAAIISEKVRLLELKPISSSRTQLLNRLSRITKLYTKTISPGIKGTLSKDFPPENMVDQKMETFWATLIMSDMPVNQKITVLNPSSLTETYRKVNGPVVEVYLRFSHVEPVNTLRLLPFGEFPIKLLDVAYKSASTSQVFRSINHVDTDATLDWIELNFPVVFCSEIRLTLLQENYRRVNYHLPKNIVSNTDIFQRIVNSKSSKIANAAFADSDQLSSLNLIDSYEEAIKDLEHVLSLADLDKYPEGEIRLAETITSSLGEVLFSVDPDSSSVVRELLDTQENETKSEIIEVSKFEYILGIREIEVSNELYAPVGKYASESFIPQSTVTQIQLEVDERHVEFVTPWQPDHRRTSTEWSVDLGGGRQIPIHPRNLTGDGGVPFAKDERIEFDVNTRAGYTRLAGRYQTAYLKKNGEFLPVDSYTIEKVIDGFPKLKLTLTGNYFDEQGIYTVDYAVGPDSYDIDVLSLFKSRAVDTPDVFKELGPDNSLSLNRFPFVDYSVINRTGQFVKDPTKSIWTYFPPTGNLATGQIKVYPKVVDSFGNILITGNYTGTTQSGLWGPRSGQAFVNVSQLNTSYFNEPFGWYAQIQDVPSSFEISGFFSTTGVVFFDPPQFTDVQILMMPADAITGIIVTGSSAGGFIWADVVLGVGAKTDDQIFVFDNLKYSPLTITIGGILANNITDYEKLQHPAFSVAGRKDTEYQYIHAGRKIYFNQPISSKEIKVTYRWITESLSVLGTLRCNKALNPDVTPKVNEMRLLLNTSVF